MPIEQVGSSTMQETYPNGDALMGAAQAHDYDGSVYLDGNALRIGDNRTRVDYSSADGKGGGEVTKQAKPKQKAQSPDSNQHDDSGKSATAKKQLDSGVQAKTVQQAVAKKK